MKRFFTTLFVALGAFTAFAKSYTGKLVVYINGNIADNSTATINVVQQGDGTYKLSLANFSINLEGQKQGVGTINIPATPFTQGSTKLLQANTKVKIEGQPALLNGSYMMCSRQGRIEIILNEQTAIKAADYISSCNNKAFWWQVGSQAIQGVFTGMAAGATGPVGLIEMNINVGIYYISEYDTELGTQATRANIAYGAKDDVVGCMTATETARESKVTADATRNAAQSSQKVMDGYQNTVKTAGKTASKPGRGQTAAQLEQSKAQKAFNIEQGKHGTLEKRASQAAKTHKNSVSARNAAFKKLANGLALNIATAMLNSQIDNYSNIQEKEYIDAAEAGVKAANELDQKNEKKNNIFMGIVANQT